MIHESAILFAKLSVEGFEFLDVTHNLIFEGEEGGPKMEGTVPLEETCPRNHTYPFGVEECKGVECIGGLAICFSGFYSLWGKAYLWECVHGAFDGCTRDALESVKCFYEHHGAAFK